MDIQMCAYVSLIYLIPCYIFYLYFTIHLFRKSSDREFKTPFFHLIKLLAIVDIIFIPIHYYAYRLGSFEFLWSIFKNLGLPNLPMTLVVYFFCVFQHSQFLCHFLLSFNRLSAVTMFNSYNRLWSSKRLWIYRIIVIFLPMIYMSWLFLYGGTMTFLKGYNYSVDSIKTGSFLLKKSTFCIIVGLSTGVLSFIMDVTTFVIICTKPQIDSKQHFRLLGISAMVLLTHMVYMFFEFFWIFPSITIMEETTYFIVLIFILDITSLISPFCNIILNPYLRKSFFNKNHPTITIAPSISFVHTRD